jgi:hypothetical protein
VALLLNEANLATLLIDLLTSDEEAIDVQTAHLRFDIGLLAERLAGATDWLAQYPETRHLPIGYFGASTGAAAALVAAATRPDRVGAVVSRGGRPDLAGPELPRVRAPTLLIVGGNDVEVIRLNDATGELDHYARMFRSIRVLETIAEASAYVTAWPRPLALEMKSCGGAEAHWSNVEHRLSFCYEMAADFAGLYRDYAHAEDPPPRQPACRCGHGIARPSLHPSRMGRARTSHSRPHARQ